MRRRTKRRLAVAAGLLVLGGALALGSIGFVQSELFAERLRRVLIDRGSDLLDEDLHIQELEIELWPTRIEFGGIQVHSRDPLRPGQEILRVERIVLDRPVFDGPRHLTLSRVELHEPALRLRVGDGELRDFPGLQRRLRTRRRPVLTVLLEELQLDGGEVSVSIDRPDATVRFAAVDAAYRAEDEEDAEVTLGAGDIRFRLGGIEERVTLESGTLRRQGEDLTLDGYRFTSPSGSVAVDGTVTLSPKDEQGAIIGGIGYQLDTVADLDLGTFSAANPDLQPILGQLDLHAVAEGVDAMVAVEGELELEGGRYGEIVLGDWQTGFAFTDKVVRFERLWVGYAGGEVTGQGRLVLGEPMTLAADLALDDVQLAEILTNATLPESWLMLTIDGTAQLDGHFQDGIHLVFDVDLPCRDLRVFDSSWLLRPHNVELLQVDHGRVAGKVLVEPDRTLLREMTVATDRTDIGIEVDFVYHRPVILDIRIDADPLALEDVGAIGNVGLAGRGPADVHIHGLSKDLQLDAHASFQDFQLVGYSFGTLTSDIGWHARGDLTFDDVAGTVGRTAYTGDGRLIFGQPVQIDAALAVDDGYVEDVTAIFTDALDVTGRFDLQGHFAGPVDALSGEGSFRGTGVEVVGERFSAVDARITAVDGRFTFPNAFFRKGRGGIYGRGYLDTAGPLNLELFSYGMDLEQVDLVQRADLDLHASVGAELRLHGTLDDPVGEGALRLADTRFGRATLGDSWVTMSLADGLMLLDGVLLGRPENHLDGSLALRGEGAYQFSFDWRELPLHLLLPARSLARSPVTLEADGHAEGQGRVRHDPDHQIRCELTRLELERGDDHLRNPEPIVLRVDGDHLVIDRLRLSGPGSELRAGGTVGPGPWVNLLIQGPVNLGLVDLFLPDLERVEAERSEAFLSITGQRIAPTVAATLLVEDGSVRTVHFPHPVEIDRARFALRDNAVVVDEFDGFLGGGPIEGFEGSRIELLDFKPHGYDVHARCVGCTVRYPSSLPWSRGTADLRLVGTAPLVTLEGDIEVDDMTYREDFRWQSSILASFGRERQQVATADRDRERGPGFALDIHLRSDGGFGISNDLGQARASGELHLHGTSRDLRLDGDVRADQGLIVFQGHDFDLTEGMVFFPDPAAIDPHFHLVLDTDISTSEQRYAISYVIDGHLADLSSMQIVGSSDPYLAEVDINALLLFGVTTDQLQGFGGGADMMAAATQGGNIILGGLMEQVLGATSEGVGERTRAALPDRIEVLPDYTSSGQFSGLIVVVEKEFHPRLRGRFSWIPLEENFGWGLDWRIGRNLHLMPYWYRYSQNTLGNLNPLGDIGDASLDMRWVIEGD